MKTVIFLSFLAFFSAISTAEVDTPYIERQSVIAFIDEMISKHRFERDDLQRWFSNANKKQVIIDAISRPAEKTKTWAEYRKIFLTPARINQGVKFWRDNLTTLKKAEKEFGVPAEIIVAIIGVETFYGKRQGAFRVIDALSTLAFDYPPRSQFFRGELTEFLLLAREQKQNPLELLGSYAGAMGYGQFIPSSYRAYAIDYSRDGFVDIWGNTEDAIGSVANYFKQHKWQPGETIVVRTRISRNYDASIINKSLKPSVTISQLRDLGYTPVQAVNDNDKATAMKLTGRWGDEFWLGLHNFYVITRYNHSRLYAMAVWQLSQEIAKAYDL